MILTKADSKIVGVRAGEIDIDLITSPGMTVKFILLRDPGDEKLDGMNAGKYTRNGPWSEKVRSALEAFLTALEEEVLPELFAIPGDKRGTETDSPTPESDTEDGTDGKSLSFPTLGGNKKTTPQI